MMASELPTVDTPRAFSLDWTGALKSRATMFTQRLSISPNEGYSSTSIFGTSSGLYEGQGQWDHLLCPDGEVSMITYEILIEVWWVPYNQRSRTRRNVQIVEIGRLTVSHQFFSFLFLIGCHEACLSKTTINQITSGLAVVQDHPVGICSRGSAWWRKRKDESGRS